MSNKDDLYTVPISVSLYDVASNPLGNRALKENNTKLLEQYLDSIGFDLEFDYEITESIEHRCKGLPSNQSFYGPMIRGVEKSTKEWLSSGRASNEALIDYHADVQMRVDLKLLSQRANPTGKLLDEMEKEYTYMNKGKK